MGPRERTGTGWSRLPKAARRGGIALAAVLVGVTGVGGALHTSWGRPWLARLGGCPAARVTAAQVDGLRKQGVMAIRGSRPAPVRPALGFHLDRTTPDDVLQWAARVGVACTAKTLGLASWHCANVPRSALPGDRAAGLDGRASDAEPSVIEDLALTFDPGRRLVSVDAFTRRLPTDTAAAAFSSSGARLAGVLGPPTDHAGDGDGAATGAPAIPGPLGTARRRFRFNDYVAIVSLTNLSSGFAVREQYLSGT